MQPTVSAKLKLETYTRILLEQFNNSINQIEPRQAEKIITDTILGLQHLKNKINQYPEAANQDILFEEVLNWVYKQENKPFSAIKLCQTFGIGHQRATHLADHLFQTGLLKLDERGNYRVGAGN